jgi:hypothetical protein
VSVEPEIVPMRGRLHETRVELDRMRRLAVVLAEALDGEVDLRIGHRSDDRIVRSWSSYALGCARQEGLL